jgi:hypothetical protein
VLREGQYLDPLMVKTVTVTLEIVCMHRLKCSAGKANADGWEDKLNIKHQYTYGTK